jgi:NADPH:quinone reductase-like Zn-dependent oxidoreductase
MHYGLWLEENGLSNWRDYFARADPERPNAPKREHVWELPAELHYSTWTADRSIAACRRALAPDGTLVLVGAGSGVGGPVARMAAASLRSGVLRQPVIAFVSEASSDDLLKLRELVEAGTVTPVLDTTYPLERTAEAIRHVESGRTRGKVVVTV